MKCAVRDLRPVLNCSKSGKDFEMKNVITSGYHVSYCEQITLCTVSLLWQLFDAYMAQNYFTL